MIKYENANWVDLDKKGYKCSNGVSITVSDNGQIRISTELSRLIRIVEDGINQIKIHISQDNKFFRLQLVSNDCFRRINSNSKAMFCDTRLTKMFTYPSHRRSRVVKVDVDLENNIIYGEIV